MLGKIILYALFSAVGLVFLKLGSGQDLGISFRKSSFSIQMNYMVIIGLCFYIASFLLSLSIMKKSNLSIFYSISVGLVYICVCVLSYFLLKESVSRLQLVGMGLILIGIVMMNMKS